MGCSLRYSVTALAVVCGKYYVKTLRVDNIVLKRYNCMIEIAANRNIVRVSRRDASLSTHMLFKNDLATYFLRLRNKVGTLIALNARTFKCCSM